MIKVGLDVDLPSIFRKTNTSYKLIEDDINLERLSNNPVKISSAQIKELFF